MQKMICFFLSFLWISGIKAQTLLEENFSGAFPPTGWTMEATGWGQDPYARCGGDAQEAMLRTTGPFYKGMSGTTTPGIPRLISPVVDLTGIQEVVIEFNFFFVSVTGGTFGVATRTETGSWNVVWQTTMPKSPPLQALHRNTQVRVPVSNQNVNQPGFSFCFFYQETPMSGSNWYLDNVMLTVRQAHEVAPFSISDTIDHHPAGQLFAPFAEVVNRGLNQETFGLKHRLHNVQGNLVSDQSIMVSNLLPGEIRTVFFPFISLPEPDMEYQSMFITLLPGDLNPFNDTICNFLNTYTAMRQQVVVEVAEPPFPVPGSLPSANEVLSEMISDGNQLAAIGYHYGNAFQNISATHRVYSYYNAIELPNAIFNGHVSHVGEVPSMKQEYQTIYDREISRKTPFIIETGGFRSGNQFTIQAKARKVAAFRGIAPVMHIVLTESGIVSSTDVSDFVERLMIPDAFGTMLTFPDSAVQIVNQTFTLGSGWLPENCEVVVFIQDTLGFDILQGAKITLSSLPVGVPEAGALTGMVVSSASPNPFRESTAFGISLTEETEVAITILNSRGIVVKKLFNGMLAAKPAMFSWDGSDENGGLVPDGMYLLLIRSKAHSHVQKVLLCR